MIVGYAIFIASAVVFFRLAGRDPHATQDASFVVGAVVFGMAFAAIGGFVAGLIAGRRPVSHAGIVAGLLALGALVSLLSSAAQSAVWSQVSALGLMAPSALVGGIINASFRPRNS